MKPRVVLDARKARDFGIGRYITGLVAALARREEFNLVAIARPEDAGMFPSSVEVVASEAKNYSLGELFSLGLTLARLSPDVFHAPHYVVPLFPPGPTIVTIHDVIHLTRPEHATLTKQAYARTMIRRAVRSSSAVLTVSQAALDELARFVPGASAKATVVPNGVDDAFLVSPDPAERARVRSELSLPLRYVLFVGNDKPHKNLSGLLDALALLRKRDALDFALVLAGGAPERRAGRAREARERGIADAVVDLGVVPDRDVPPLMAEAEALVLPSLAEGFGLPVLEAQALGVPAICSRRGGLPEAGGDAALYVEPEDPSSIAAAVERVLSDERLRVDLGERGKRRARSCTWTATAARTADVYRKALDAARGPRR